MALGAQRSTSCAWRCKTRARMTLAGTAIGIVAALGLTQLMASMLFGVRPTDRLHPALSRWFCVGLRYSRATCPPSAPPKSIPWWRCATSNRSQIPQHDSHAAEADHAEKVLDVI